MTPSFYNDTLKAQRYAFWKFLTSKSAQKICQIVKLCNHEFFVGPREIFFWFLKRVSPNLFSRFPLTSLKLLPLPLVQWLSLGLCVKYATLMSQRCALSALACNPFHLPSPLAMPPKSFPVAPAPQTSTSTTPPIYHLTALVVVGAVAWTKLNPASGAWPSEGETLRKSLI